MTAVQGVYLGYPIDQRGPASLSFLFEQIERLKQQLINMDAAAWVFDPGDAFTVSTRAVPDDSLPKINRHALNAADVVVAFLPRDVASIGVPMEIDRARAMGKHVFVVSDARSSWMLAMKGIYRATDWENDTIDGIAELIAQLEPPMASRQFEDLPFKMLEGHGLGELPKRAYADDAGLDLTVSDGCVIEPGEFMDVPTSVAVQLPPHTWGLVIGRSSAFRKKSLLVLPGVIDAGYRGELFSAAYNTSKQAVKLNVGERIAQLILVPNMTRHMTPVVYPDLLPSPRGERGFGSSGA